MTDTSTVIDRETTPTTDDGDHEKQSHVVSPAAAYTEAIINGTPCTALCGKTWVPSRDPKKYPLCQTCQDILADIALSRHGY